MAKTIPTLAYSEMTGRHYLVTAWLRPGLARTKIDITDQVRALNEREQASLLKSIRGALDALRKGQAEAAMAWLDSALDTYPEPAEQAG